MTELVSQEQSTRSQKSSASAAQFSLSAEEFALSSLFNHVPDARVEIDPSITNPPDCTLLIVRTDKQESAVDAALRSAPTVGTIEFFGECADGWMYRIRWEGCPRRLFQRLVAEHITLRSIQGRDSYWRLQLLAPDRKGIAEAHDIMDELDCTADCQRISTFSGDPSCPGLTDKQRETLIETVEAGYYNIPQNTTMDELADELGVSHQALSERLHRAYETLIKNTLIADGN